MKREGETPASGDHPRILVGSPRALVPDVGAAPPPGLAGVAAEVDAAARGASRLAAPPPPLREGEGIRRLRPATSPPSTVRAGEPRRVLRVGPPSPSGPRVTPFQAGAGTVRAGG